MPQSSTGSDPRGRGDDRRETSLLVASALLNGALVTALALVLSGGNAATNALTGNDAPESAPPEPSVAVEHGASSGNSGGASGVNSADSKDPTRAPSSTPTGMRTTRTITSTTGPGLPDDEKEYQPLSALRSCVDEASGGLDLGATMSIDAEGTATGIRVFRGPTQPGERDCIQAALEARTHAAEGHLNYLTLMLHPDGTSTTIRSNAAPLYEDDLGRPGVTAVAVADSCRARRDWLCIERVLQDDPAIDRRGVQLLLQAYLARGDREEVEAILSTISPERLASGYLSEYQAAVWRMQHGHPANPSEGPRVSSSFVH